MESSCIICETPSVSRGVGPTSNIFIACPKCGVKYEVSWGTYRTMKKKSLNPADGQKLLGYIRQVQGPKFAVISGEVFFKLFGKLPQDYD